MHPPARAVFGRASDTAAIDCYDAAAARESSVLSALLDVATRGGADTVVYLAEHGAAPELGSDGERPLRTPEQLEIPLFFWVDSPFWAERPEAVAALRANRARPVLSTDLHDTLQDLLGAYGRRFSARRSLLHQAYVASPRLLFGLIDRDRWSVGGLALDRARANLRELARTRPARHRQIWAHRVDTMGKLRQAMQLFAGVELDVTPCDGELRVYHPPAPDLGITLRDYLEVASARPDLHFWFDVKLASAERDGALVLDTLTALDRRYALRGRAIVELPPAHDNLRVASQLSARGWRVSHYLPGAEGMPLMQGRNDVRLAAYLERERDYLKGAAFTYLSYANHERALAELVLHDRRVGGIERLSWNPNLDASAADFLERIAAAPESVFLVGMPSRYEN